MSELTNTVLAAVEEERDRQDQKWGEQNHDPAYYYVILMEEVGEVAEAILHMSSGDTLTLRNGTVLSTTQELEKHYLEELTHVQAVAVAMTEAKLREKVREARERTGYERGEDRTRTLPEVR